MAVDWKEDGRQQRFGREMRIVVFVVTTTLFAMPWVAVAQDAGMPTTAIAPYDPVLQLRRLHELGPAQGGSQLHGIDSTTRRVQTIRIRPDGEAEDAPAPSERLRAEKPREERRAEIPSSRPPSRFRQIYFCDEKNPRSVSALGEITALKKVTVIGTGGKSVATVKEILPAEAFLAGIFQGTRLELAPGAPCSAASIAVLARPASVEVVRLKEISDRSAIKRVANYMEVRRRNGVPAADLDMHPAVYLTNYQITEAKVFALSPKYAAVLANVTYDAMVYDGIRNKYEKADAQADPMLFVVGSEVTEVTMDSRHESSICDSLVSAFKISSRLHIHVAANGCHNGIKGHMVFNLSGPAPKPVFSDWDLSD